MKKMFLFIPALLLVGMFFYACQEEFTNSPETGKLDLVTINETGGSCTDIIAGQNFNEPAGSVCLNDIDTDNDGFDDALEITFTTTGDWVIRKTHFHLGYSLNEIPRNKGGLIPGQFEYHSPALSDVTEYSFVIPFEDFDFHCTNAEIFAASHLELARPDGMGGWQTETGWGEGDNRPGKNWSMVFSFIINCDTPNDPPPPSGCETAFAYDGVLAECFSEYSNLIPNDNRWGWTIGPLNYGSYTFPIYAAAGNCDLNNGYLVGTLYIDYSGPVDLNETGEAIITFSMDPGYSLDETHLYVGDEPIYKKKQGQGYVYTVAPGQYPYKNEDLNGASSDVYNVYIDGPIYVIAHAVVCGAGQPPCDPAGLFYGTMVGTPERIYKIDVTTTIPILSIIKEGLNSISCGDDNNYPNGLAWDEVNNIFIYAECDGTIWTYKEGDATSTELTVEYALGTPPLGSTNLPINGGAWYNGKYYFIQYNTNKLYEGVISGNTITLKLLYNLSQTCGFFGDVAFDPEDDGIMYGWCEVGTAKVSTFFKVDIATGTLTVIKNTGYEGIRQLAFAYTADGWKLYTASAGTAVIATVDKATGVETAYYTSSIKFTDIASGPKCK